jgi:hypothetical protein
MNCSIWFLLLFQMSKKKSKTEKASAKRWFGHVRKQAPPIIAITSTTEPTTIRQAKVSDVQHTPEQLSPATEPTTSCELNTATKAGYSLVSTILKVSVPVKGKSKGSC